METREPCQVPNCRCSSAKYAELNCTYLCSRHYAFVPKWMKRRRTRLAAALRKRGELDPGGAVYRVKSWRANHVMWMAWKLMVKAAIQREAGI